jgi:hypothetical protein
MTDCSIAAPMSQQLAEQLEVFVTPLLTWLDEQIDKRLVRTFLATLGAIVSFRHGGYGLLLSELGGYILSPNQAPAGTKRLSNLLRCERWQHTLIERFLWQQADQRVTDLRRAAAAVFLIWDESVLEKPESVALEGLCAVRSSRAARLKRIKPGYYNPPGGRPIFVPGMQWLSLLVLGGDHAPLVAAMHWWTTRGLLASDRRTEEGRLLQRCAQQWGRDVLHVWDRGFAGAPWLGQVFQQRLRFILRWPKRYMLVDGQGKRNAWKIARGKRAWQRRQIWDARSKCWRQTGVLAIPVRHPEYLDEPLWLVISRPGKGREPWYLLTNDPVDTPEAAWHIVFAYARRWQVEMTYRYGKTELAMASPRVWRWENRLKLLLMVTLAYAFLLSLLQASYAVVRDWLLKHWCHRTGKRYREVSVPLYRLRAALSRLWLAFPPRFCYAWPDSG